LLLGAAFDQVTLTPWQAGFAVVYPAVCVAGLSWAAKAVFGLRHREGRTVMAGVRALAAFGRNDIRGTYRDPLLVMVVVAPVIWTTGVALLTRASPRCWLTATGLTWFRTTRWSSPRSCC
jgi:hypothetical protein